MIQSVNPYNNEVLYTFNELTTRQVDEILDNANKTFREWKNTSFEHRSGLLRKLAEILFEKREVYGKVISLEIGKPIRQSIAEIEKCAWGCNYYADNAEAFLKREIIATDAYKSFVSYEPLGPILAVMPWNYPFWQVFRFAAPAVMAGNVGLLKHASNVMKSAGNIEEAFLLAGFPMGVFQNLIIKSDKVEGIIKDKRIKAVTLTGSKPAGSAVASTAASEIKKAVLELGGNNAFVVFNDADIDKAINVGINARYQNTGQSCIAAKRLLLQKEIAEAFLQKFTARVKELKSGNPLDEDTFIGTVAREDLAIALDDQVKRSVAMGARAIAGGNREGAYYEPTILTGVTPEMPVFKEETFGPVLAVTIFDTEEEAVKLVNDSDFGLGVSLFTEDIDRAISLTSQFEEGAVFINELVKSDPRLPFGGVKTSGFGRELSHHGIKEFVNIKTVFVNK